MCITPMANNMGHLFMGFISDRSLLAKYMFKYLAHSLFLFTSFLQQLGSPGSLPEILCLTVQLAYLSSQRVQLGVIRDISWFFWWGIECKSSCI